MKVDEEIKDFCLWAVVFFIGHFLASYFYDTYFFWGAISAIVSIRLTEK